MKLRGAITALVTPLRGGAVDYEALTALIELQIAAGIDGIVAVGTTGESATLDMREHMEVIAHMVRVSAGRTPIIAGAGGNSTAEALELSRASEKAGADALLHVTPYYNKPPQEGLYRHFRALAEATALPIILYNVPSRTACDLSVETTARLAELDRIVAIKDATGCMRRASELVERCGDALDVLSGDDFTAYPLLCLGGRGIISVISNVLPAAVADMCRAAESGDWVRARELHFSLQPLTRILFEEANPIPVKAALELAGHISGEVRPPLCPASPPLRARLHEELVRLGALAK